MMQKPSDVEKTYTTRYNYVFYKKMKNKKIAITWYKINRDKNLTDTIKKRILAKYNEILLKKHKDIRKIIEEHKGRLKKKRERRKEKKQFNRKMVDKQKKQEMVKKILFEASLKLPIMTEDSIELLYIADSEGNRLMEDTYQCKKDKKQNYSFKKNQKEKIIKKYYRREKMLVKSNNTKDNIAKNNHKSTLCNFKNKKMRTKKLATKMLSQNKTYLTTEEIILYDSIKTQKKKREHKKKIFEKAIDLVQNKHKELNIGRKIEKTEQPDWEKTIKLIKRYKEYLLVKKRKRKRQIYTNIVFEENLTKMVLPSSVRVSSENEAKTMVKFINKISQDMRNCNFKTKTQKQNKKETKKEPKIETK